MSKELDAKIDATRKRLIEVAGTQISMGNYKQQLRAYQEMFLSVINTVDEINEAIDTELKADLTKDQAPNDGTLNKGDK